MAVQKSVEMTRDKLIDSLSQPGTQPREDGSMVSAPGSPPAMQTGDLMRSVFTRSAGSRHTLGVTMPYARFLEYGTGNMAARPFLHRMGGEWKSTLISLLRSK